MPWLLSMRKKKTNQSKLTTTTTLPIPHTPKSNKKTKQNCTYTALKDSPQLICGTNNKRISLSALIFTLVVTAKKKILIAFMRHSQQVTISFAQSNNIVFRFFLDMFVILCWMRVAASSTKRYTFKKS
mmetsp:Transcript_66731/g.77454  ORF Transcript_66731/g.77454 Transcript_66731/m.77454 type:complete len:128 (+) Transcript_66731:528-911(+)